MKEVMLRLVDVPVARMLVLAGFIFVLVGVLGKIEGKIEPGPVGRAGAAVLGILLLAIGVFMQYSELQYAEMHELNTKTQLDQSKQLQASAPAAAALPIKVVAATFGKNCNAKPGNATSNLSKACEGQSICDFTIDATQLEDPSPNCSKDFSAEWKCGEGSTTYSATLSSLSGKGDVLHLACAN